MILIQRGIRVVPAASDQLPATVLVHLVVDAYRYGLKGDWRFWREERGVSRWSWGPEPSCDENIVHICPIDVREVELSRGKRALVWGLDTRQAGKRTYVDRMAGPSLHLPFGVSEDLHSGAIDNRAI